MAWDDIPDYAHALAQAILQSLKARDPYTYGHCRRVGRNARLLARDAGLNEFEQAIVEYSSVFHDIGKIGIPDSILMKPGKLTPEEEKIMQEHPIKSVEILQPLAKIPFFRSLLPGIRHHHERYDGLGYPDRLAGENVPLVARIILIADTFDAMTTSRIYRKGRPQEVAYEELIKYSGRQFDAKLVEVFLKGHPNWGTMDAEITEEFVAANYKRAA